MRTRSSQRGSADIWPGFVDALSTLLMVIIFLLAVFMLAQFYLSQLLEGQDEELSTLEETVSDLSGQLDIERDTSADLQRSLDQLQSDLQSVIGERDDLESDLTETESDRDTLTQRLAILGNERSTLQQRLADMRAERDARAQELAETRTALDIAQDTITADKETIELQLAEAARLQADLEALEALKSELELEIAGQLEQLGRTEEDRAEIQEELGDSEKARIEALAKVSLLTEQITTLSNQLEQFDALLGSKQEEIDQQSAQIADLGRRLNLALAAEVAELSQFRSDFFGRLRRVLGDRSDVSIVGDRFVFQSEVLFDQGSAQIGEGGRQQLATLARTLRSIASEIPQELPWVLQVDGHTDRVPISTPQFPSNWELSTARAISVGRFLISQGIPAERVAARGFAEFQPLDPGDSSEAYRRNRRIEIKLTTR